MATRPSTPLPMQRPTIEEVNQQQLPPLGILDEVLARAEPIELQRQQIRMRAYELFEERERNAEWGTAEQDWLRAEAEVRGLDDKTAA